MEPALRRIDELLEDEALVDGVLEAMRGRFAHSGRRGRYGTAAEVALRMLVLKHLKSWSYEQLQWEVTGNLVYRHFCRIDGGKVPDAKTMVRLGQLLEGEALRRVFDRVVQLAAKRHVTQGRKMRVDTTVVETPIRHPSDSRLCVRTSPKCSAGRSSVRGPWGWPRPAAFAMCDVALLDVSARLPRSPAVPSAARPSEPPCAGRTDDCSQQRAACSAKPSRR
jgi:hypothetical protein